ncbi:xylulokinase [Haliangium ochraceum]|uniref:Xylulose kinase n=1 Tax=Haliangium ochraceum (strain DSM 14365 / JCM 11303 / SMP-2) TaxID=502025 RepID=D0LPZ9_HALO1|nr:xylulokinase [Haliangium ochraceum]ACY17036.1 xylulokinase [Haliangium ochraceum DSM 14365]
MTVTLGFDIGTSGVKAVVLGEDGAVSHQATVGYEVSRPRPLWSEQDPELWWRALLESTAALRAQGAPLDDVRGLALAGQMHGATLLDDAGEVLRPCILWNDGRSHAECLELMDAVADFGARSGNLAMPGFTAPKLLWLRKHEPEIFRRVAKVLLPKDYLVYRLTGRFASEMSDAAGTLWLDPARRDWDDVLLAATGLTREHMPVLFEGCQPVAALSQQAAEELGLPRVPVIAGAGDNAGGAIGVGVIDPGQTLVSLGTSGVIAVVSDAHHACPERTVHAFCHCIPERWHQMAVTLSAAGSLGWLAKISGTPVAELLAALERSGKRETPTLFLPYLAGERTPHNDPLAVGQFYGLSNSTELSDMTLAVLEGVAYSFCDGRDALRAAGARFDEVALIGGGARSPLWRQLLADAMEMTLGYRTGGDVGPALGAARLARVGIECADGGHALTSGGALGDTGARADAIRALCPQPPLECVYQPRTERADYHRGQLDRYRRLYELTRPLRSAGD